MPKVSFALKTAKTNLGGGIFFEGLSGSQINRFFYSNKTQPRARERESHFTVSCACARNLVCIFVDSHTLVALGWFLTRKPNDLYQEI
jgi:hypothetical protein